MRAQADRLDPDTPLPPGRNRNVLNDAIKYAKQAVKDGNPHEERDALRVLLKAVTGVRYE